MGPIAIVRGSTAYIPKGLVEESNFTVAPRSPISGDQAYRNELDIQPDDFYARPKTAKVMPTTSQSAVVTMREIFGSLVVQQPEVRGIFILSNLSGAVRSALQAQEALGSAASRVWGVDSGPAAMALGFQGGRLPAPFPIAQP